MSWLTILLQSLLQLALYAAYRNLKETGSLTRAYQPEHKQRQLTESEKWIALGSSFLFSLFIVQVSQLIQMIEGINQ